MKKLSILLCLSAVAMLTACGGNSSSSATSSAEATSSVAESENSATSEASNQEGEAHSGETASSDAATSNEAEASSEEASTGWSQKILDEIAEYCGEGFEVPYLSGKVTEAYYDEDYYCYSIVVENTDLDGYADLVEEAGYAVAYDENYEAYSGVMILDNYDNVELSFYLLSSGEEIEIDVYYTEAYQAWPSEEIDYVAEQWEVTATPIEFAANAYLTGADSNLSYYYIKAYEDDPEASAEALIKAYTDSADWTVYTMGEGEESYYLFASANGDSWVTLEVGEDTVTVVWQVAQGLLAWPSDQIASFLADAGLENPTDIPVFEADVYSMQVSDPYFVISVDYEEAQTADPAAAYAKALTDAGWTVTTEEDELGVIYFAHDATGDLFVNFYYVDDYTWADWGYEFHTMTIAIASWQAVLDNGYTLVDAWPSEQVASFVKEEGDTIPEIAGDGYAYALADKALYLRVEGATAEAYKALLEGWTIVEEEGGFLAENDATDPSLRLYFYEEYGYLWIEAENILNGGEFDFSSTAQMTAQDGAKSVWADSKVTFTVEKGSSSQNVGNGSYFADPLRVYAGQVITIASTDGSPIESVEFETDGSSYASALAKSTVSSGTLAADSWTVTWTPTEEVSSFTITLSAQVRFQSATVVLK